MVYIILTIICSSGIALMLKHNIMKKGNELLFLSANYLAAAVLSGIIFLFTENAAYSLKSLLFGFFLGLLFVIGFLSFSKAVKSAGTALAAVSSRLSVIVPVVLSVIIFSEYPGLSQSGGLAVSVITVILFYYSARNHGKKHKHHSGFLFLITALLFIGINDFAMKIFKEWMPQDEKQFFLTCVFAFAFIYSLVFFRVRGYKFEADTFRRGIVLGIPNLFSSVFLISALNEVPAIVVYPVTGIGIILITALMAMLIWNEKMNLIGYLAVLSGIISVLLLSI